MVITLIVLAGLGLAAGSFVNAVVWRLRQIELLAPPKAKSQKPKAISILSGRSQCPHCRHTLAWYDLIPVFSWLWLRGKCRYCGQPISMQYPIVELTMAAVFVGSYSFWPGGVYGTGEWTLLITWLVTSVGLLALFIYDLKWMLLSNKIIYPTLAAAAVGQAVYIGAFESRPGRALGLWVLSLAVASGFFYLIFKLSSGKWIGYGDVRLGWIIGTLLAHPVKSLGMLFLASVLGSLAALPDLIRGKKTLASRLPFGPFLIIATAITMLWGDTILEQYRKLIGN